MIYRVVTDVPDTLTDMAGIKPEDDGTVLFFYGMDDENEEGGDGCFYVRLASYDETKAHPLFRSLMGKRVRITVEEL